MHILTKFFSFKKEKKFLLFALISLMGACTHKQIQSDKRIAAITGITIGNKKIDSTYFEGKTTLINFFYIGCPPCMIELNMLKKINTDYKNKNFQILSIAPQTPAQLRAFNSNNATDYSYARNYFKADIIDYDILPECPEKAIKQGQSSKETVFEPQCDRISKLFHIDGYPQSYLVNKYGQVVKHFEGLEMDSLDNPVDKKIRMVLDSLLNEN